MPDTKRNYTRKPVTVKSLLEKENFTTSENDDRPDLREADVAKNIILRFLRFHPELVEALFGDMLAALAPSSDSETVEG